MRKTLTLLLAALVLVLGAATARLWVRVRDLDEELARQGRRGPKPSAVDPALRTSAAPARAESSAAAPASGESGVRPPAPGKATVHPGPASAGVPGAATKAVDLALQSAVTQLAFQAGDQTWTLRRGTDDPALGLTEAQKRSIDELRKTCSAQTQAYADMIQKIEDSTDQSIRRLLTAQQLSVYEGSPADPGPAPAGQRKGFLGVQGADQDGGGVKVVQVIQGSSASASGLLPGDVILEVNGQPISDYASLSSRIQEIGEGVPISLKISRGGTEFYHGLQLGGRNP
ncbi:MAG TPA: PDZ domain-containing protein [Planctomycetota bacterium]|nr:PDZ domain-containing protein [Planctomycetota bacterium]